MEIEHLKKLHRTMKRGNTWDGLMNPPNRKRGSQ
jgi:hypothetical protein